PAPEAEPALLDELAVEAQAVAADVVVDPLGLAHAVDVDLERRSDPGRQADHGGHRLNGGASGGASGGPRRDERAGGLGGQGAREVKALAELASHRVERVG